MLDWTSTTIWLLEQSCSTQLMRSRRNVRRLKCRRTPVCRTMTRSAGARVKERGGGKARSDDEKTQRELASPLYEADDG